MVVHNGDGPRRLVAGVGTPIIIVSVAAAILLLPPVMNIGLEIGGSAAILGVPPEVARRASELSVQELLIGPGSFTFAATPGGPPFYGPAEASHMQTVRVVVYGFFGLVLAGAIAVVVSTRRMSGPDALRAVRLGATGLVLVFAAIGVGLIVAFDALFTLFHRIVFPSGGWMFDPTTQRIVQLYPTPFWEFAAGTLAGLSVAIGLLVIAVRRCICAGARRAVRLPSDRCGRPKLSAVRSRRARSSLPAATAGDLTSTVTSRGSSEALLDLPPLRWLGSWFSAHSQPILHFIQARSPTLDEPMGPEGTPILQRSSS